MVLPPSSLFQSCPSTNCFYPPGIPKSAVFISLSLFPLGLMFLLLLCQLLWFSMCGSPEKQNWFSCPAFWKRWANQKALRPCIEMKRWLPGWKIWIKTEANGKSHLFFLTRDEVGDLSSLASLHLVYCPMSPPPESPLWSPLLLDY